MTVWCKIGKHSPFKNTAVLCTVSAILSKQICAKPGISLNMELAAAAWCKSKRFSYHTFVGVLWLFKHFMDLHTPLTSYESILAGQRHITIYLNLGSPKGAEPHIHIPLYRWQSHHTVTLSIEGLQNWPRRRGLLVLDHLHTLHKLWRQTNKSGTFITRKNATVSSAVSSRQDIW